LRSTPRFAADPAVPVAGLSVTVGVIDADAAGASTKATTTAANPERMWRQTVPITSS
jgi:hypothetical protein